MNAPVLTKERVYTETEHKYWLEVHTKELRDEVRNLRGQLKAAKFQAAVAEWAIAGVMSRQLSLRVAIDDTRTQNTLDLARAVGVNAGSQFLHAAELAFQDHAEFSALKMQCPPHVHFQHASGRVDSSTYNWPRPYK